MVMSGLPPEIVQILNVRGGEGKRGQLSGIIREYVYARDAYRCVNCKLQFRPKQRRSRGANRNRLTIDHIRPRSEGGTNDPRNCRSLCRRCHEFLNKHKRLPDETERPWATSGRRRES